MSLAQARLRIARPTDQLDIVTRGICEDPAAYRVVLQHSGWSA